ncbi:MAG: hypothetical protein M0R06_00785 [Sphaerochaeta sp.]|jgi:hypothetical protein|nr:hypothetical protein [Sphaerochaeta sp.]
MKGDMIRFELSTFDGVQPHGAVVLKINGSTYYVPKDKVCLRSGFVYVDAWTWHKALERKQQGVVKVQLKQPDWW